MASPTQPPKWAIDCHRSCNLHPDRIGAEKADALLRRFIEAKEKNEMFGARRFGRFAEGIVGFTVNEAAAFRHLKHYKEVDPEAEDTGHASDIEILDAVIQSAWRNRKNWKPTLRDMLEAMGKKHSLTGGSAFADMLSAMEGGLRLAEGSGDEEEEVEVPENVEALLSEDERPVDDEDE